MGSDAEVKVLRDELSQVLSVIKEKWRCLMIDKCQASNKKPDWLAVLDATAGEGGGLTSNSNRRRDDVGS